MSDQLPPVDMSTFKPLGQTDTQPAQPAQSAPASSTGALPPVDMSTFKPLGGSDTAQQGGIGPAPEQGFWDRAKSVVSNSPIGYALEKSLPKVSDALGIHPTETVYSPEYEAHHEELLPVENLISPTSQDVGARAARGVLKTAAGITTPTNLAIMAATSGLGIVADAPAVAVTQRLISAGFGYQMIQGAIGRYPQIKEAIKTGDYASAAEMISQSLSEGALAGQAVKHAAGDVHGEGQSGKIQADEATAKLLRARGDERQANLVDALAKQGGNNYFRPAHKDIAGVEVPITAAKQENAPFVAKVAAKLATPGKANEFAKTQTRPAATTAAVSTLGQMVKDKVDAHSALRAGEAAPDRISGTSTQAPYNTIDDAQAALESGARPTYQTADAIDAQEREAWEAQKKTAVDAHKTAIDAHNQQVGEANAEGEKLDTIPFDETQADLPERPKFLSELRAAEDAAWHMAKNGNAEERAQAYDKDIPKAEKDTDNWFKQHESQIPSAEYDSAKDLTYRAKRLETIAASLRAPLLNNAVTARTLNGVEAKIDNQAIRRGQAPGAFKRLLGDEGYQNWKNVTEVMKNPENVDSNAKPGVGDMGVGAAAFAIGVLSHVWGPALGTVISLKFAQKFILDRALFNPEFGKWFTENFNRFKNTGGKVSSDMIDSFHNLMTKNPMSDKESQDAGFSPEEIANNQHTPIVGGAKLSQRPAPTEGTPQSPAYRTGEQLSYNSNPAGIDNTNMHHRVETRDAHGNKIGELAAQDTKPGEITVRSNQIYDEAMQGKGRGSDQLRHLLGNVSDDTNTVKSDISTTPDARRAWESVAREDPNAVSKQTYPDGQVQYTVDMDRYRRGVEEPVKQTDANILQHPITQDHIERAFPGQKVEKIDDRNFTVNLENGNNVRIKLQDVVDGVGVEIRPGNAVFGRWDSLNDGGVMRLAGIAGEDTLRHETFHAAMDILPQRLREAVLKEYGDEEKAADAYGDWKPGEKSDSIFGQVRDYFKQLYDKIFRPAQEAFRRVQEGKVWNQPAERVSGVGYSRPDFSVAPENISAYSEAEMPKALPKPTAAEQPLAHPSKQPPVAWAEAVKPLGK